MERRGLLDERAPKRQKSGNVWEQTDSLFVGLLANCRNGACQLSFTPSPQGGISRLPHETDRSGNVDFSSTPLRFSLFGPHHQCSGLRSDVEHSNIQESGAQLDNASQQQHHQGTLFAHYNVSEHSTAKIRPKVAAEGPTSARRQLVQPTIESIFSRPTGPGQHHTVVSPEAVAIPSAGTTPACFLCLKNAAETGCRCPFCERVPCKTCCADCDNCGTLVCNVCAVADYSQRYDRILCPGCCNNTGDRGREPEDMQVDD